MEIIDAWMQHPSAEFLAGPVFDSLYAECVELGIPFCLQVGHTGPLCPSEPGRPIPYLDTAALFLHGNAERVFGLAPGSGQAAGQQETSEERAQA